MFKYFDIESIKCAEDARKQYRSLAMAHHPDAGGTTEAMQQVNNEWARVWAIYKDIHADSKQANTYYTASTPTTEAPEDFINIMNALLSLHGLIVELCGRWLWISGDTMQHKEALKAMGCKWGKTKKMWSWHYDKDGVHPYKKSQWDMGKIRNTFGSEKFEKESRPALQ